VSKLSAKITLTGCLSLAVGRFRFIKGKPITTSDPSVMSYCKGHPNFRYVELEVEGEEKSSSPATLEIIMTEKNLTVSVVVLLNLIRR